MDNAYCLAAAMAVRAYLPGGQSAFLAVPAVHCDHIFVVILAHVLLQRLELCSGR